jgi:hypothetical protein
LLVLRKCPEKASLSIVISVWEIERSPLEPNLPSRRDGEVLLLVSCAKTHYNTGGVSWRIVMQEKPFL